MNERIPYQLLAIYEALDAIEAWTLDIKERVKRLAMPEEFLDAEPEAVPETDAEPELEPEAEPEADEPPETEEPEADTAVAPTPRKPQRGGRRHAMDADKLMLAEDIAEKTGLSFAYVKAVLAGSKKPSKELAEKLEAKGVKLPGAKHGAQ